MSDKSPTDDVPFDIKAEFELALRDFNVIHLGVINTPEVILPEYLMTEPWIARETAIHLEYGLDMPVPIADLSITDKGIAATLSFNREPCYTFIPWDAIASFTCEGLRAPPPKPRPKLGLVE